MSQSSLVRPAEDRPDLLQVAGRILAVSVTTGVALELLALVLDGFDIDRPIDALLAGLVVGLLNAVVWPMLAFVVVPISVLTLGLGAIVLDALLVGLVLDRLPGVTLSGFWTSLCVVIGLAAVSSLVASVLALDDAAWFDRRMAHLARRRASRAAASDVAGIVFVQVDGLAEAVLRRALRSGDAPTMDSWLRDGSYRLIGWETGWSSQTGVSQCGILHGSTEGMPAFRWIDKATGRTIVSNRPESAAAIERAHSDGRGLLAHHGSSYGNLFSGDAERAVLTMSGITRRKEGRFGAGYVGYFSRPQQATRTLLHVLVDVAHERRAALLQRRRGVEPRVPRNLTYALLRAFTTVVSRDVSVQGVLTDVAEGRAAVYVDLLGYDEVAHHSGLERADALAVLRDVDQHVGRIARALRWAPRPYHLVLLSDHGQTQGTPFHELAGETLAELVGRLCGGAISGDPDAEKGRTESTAWLRQARADDAAPDLDALESQVAPRAAPDVPTVLGSGSLGLVTLPGPPRRLTRAEIDERFPALIPGLVDHPHIGFVLVASEGGSLVLGSAGVRNLVTGDVSGADPLAPFGPSAVEQVREVDAYPTAADLMINARYDPDLEEVAAFESQVSSHGGLGGPQTRPFLLYPTTLSPPPTPIFTSVAMHRVLKSWLAEVGQPVELPWLATGEEASQLRTCGAIAEHGLAGRATAREPDGDGVRGRSPRRRRSR